MLDYCKGYVRLWSNLTLIPSDNFPESFNELNTKFSSKISIDRIHLSYALRIIGTFSTVISILVAYYQLINRI